MGSARYPQLNVVLPPALRRFVDREARRRKVSRGEVVRQLIEEAMETAKCRAA